MSGREQRKDESRLGGAEQDLQRLRGQGPGRSARIELDDRGPESLGPVAGESTGHDPPADEIELVVQGPSQRSVRLAHVVPGRRDRHQGGQDAGGMVDVVEQDVVERLRGRVRGRAGRGESLDGDQLRARDRDARRAGAGPRRAEGSSWWPPGPGAGPTVEPAIQRHRAGRPSMARPRPRAGRRHPRRPRASAGHRAPRSPARRRTGHRPAPSRAPRTGRPHRRRARRAVAAARSPGSSAARARAARRRMAGSVESAPARTSTASLRRAGSSPAVGQRGQRGHPDIGLGVVGKRSQFDRQRRRGHRWSTGRCRAAPSACRDSRAAVARRPRPRESPPGGRPGRGEAGGAASG